MPYLSPYDPAMDSQTAEATRETLSMEELHKLTVQLRDELLEAYNARGASRGEPHASDSVSGRGERSVAVP
jgi:hypothetical protein